MVQVCRGEISNRDLKRGGLPARSDISMTMLGAIEDLNVKDKVPAF